jgi:hypothetical protein
MTARPSKYRNVPTYVDGIRFASKLEAKRYGELLLLERAGEIRDLKLQPSYKLDVKGKPVCEYRGDFAYLTNTGLPVTEDCKGMETAEFKVKAKLFRALFGREIVRVTK